MSTELGEPEVSLRLGPQGIQLSIQAEIAGNGTDWHPDVASTWMLELWERCLTVARMSQQYGIAFDLDSSALVPPVQPPAAAALPALMAPMRPSPSEELEARIGRLERSGQLLPTRGEPHGSPLKALWEAAQTILKTQPQGMAVAELQRRVIARTDLSPSLVERTLRLFKAEGRIEHLMRRGQGWGQGGGYRLTGDSGAGYAGTFPNHLQQILPLTEGKRFLLVRPQVTTAQLNGIAATLRLRDLCWAWLEDGSNAWTDPGKRSDLDLVILSSLPRAEAKPVETALDQAGKPYMRLWAGLEPDRFVTGLWRQRSQLAALLAQAPAASLAA